VTRAKTLAGLGIAGAAAAFVLLVPQAAWWQCPIHATTGIYCPGCGGQRWLHALLQGRFEEAWHYNQLLSVSPILALIGWALFRFKTPTWLKVAALIVLLILLIVFVIWRNQPPQVYFLQR